MRSGKALFLIVVLVFTSFINTPIVRANITSCADAEVTPHVVAPNSTTNFTVRIRNTDVNAISWIDIERPTGLFNIEGASFSGWSMNVAGDVVSLSGSSFSNNQTITGTITATVGNNTSSENNWIIKVSDNPSGPGTFFCSGSIGVAVEGDLTDEIPPQLSNIRLSNLKHDSVVISWDTDEPATSVINYGTTEEYGLTKSNTNLITNHSLTLTNLTSDTGYYFEIRGEDAVGNEGGGDTGTFLTSTYIAPQVIKETEVITTVQIIPGKETVPPTIEFTTKLTGLYNVVPEISGIATDNDALAKIEYSINDGVTWQAVEKSTGLGSKKMNFSFTPIIRDDGNYQVLARAIDAALNVTNSAAQTLIIDTGPPVFGGLVLNEGATIFMPGSEGDFVFVAGASRRVTLNAVGGALTIALKTEPIKKSGEKVNTQTFSLSQSKETGLWKGVVQFKQPGRYNLVASGVDGANNSSITAVSTVNVLPAGKISNPETGAPLSGIEVRLYAYDLTTNSWVLWDGTPYGQVNPQRTNKQGGYNLLIPEGKYYLEFFSPEHKKARSRIFTVSNPTSIAQSISLNERSKLKAGIFQLKLPNIFPDTFNVTEHSVLAEKEIVSTNLPTFSLPTTDKKLLSDVDLLGKPTVITFMNTWTPVAREQLPVLDEVASEFTEVNFVPIFLLEPSSLLEVYRKIGGYDLHLVSDRAGVLTKINGSRNTPVHFFVNRKGVIKNTIGGVLSKEEIIKEFTSL